MKPLRIFGTILVLALLGFQALSEAEVVKKEHIRPFAKNFKCSDPLLQWQFDHLTTLYGENQKMKSKSSSPRGIVDQASDVGGDGDWLYRGVTNRQFNESQILRVIFNDPTSVSESRWFTEKMYVPPKVPRSGDLVKMRADFQSLDFEDQCRLFESAYKGIAGDIEKLITQVSGPMNAFSEHVRVGSSYNSTPQAIQFLTPHKDYAEGYGEFVLHIREVVKRGIDVERYNFHNPSWRYQIGSIYRMDRDEYMVPSHIPSWDVQMIKVRAGTGWHKGDYGPPLYYYSKLTEKDNPCNVVAIQVDRPGSSDASRQPVGIILKCPKSEKCESKWDQALPQSEIARLKDVVQNTKVAGQALYYVPYRDFQSNKPEVIKQSSLATLVDMYPLLSDEVRKNSELWKEVMLKGYKSDFASALELQKLNPLLRTPELAAVLKEDFSKWVSSKEASISSQNIGSVIEMAAFFKMQGDSVLGQNLVSALENRRDRPEMIRVVSEKTKIYPQLIPVVKKMEEKFASFKDLSPTEEIAAEQLKAPGVNSPGLAQAIARAIQLDPNFGSRYHTVMNGSSELKAKALEDALTLISLDVPSYRNLDGTQLWKLVSAQLKPGPMAESIKGLLIDFDIANGKKTAAKLIEDVGAIGLPDERGVDTLRSLWGVAKTESETAPRPSGVPDINRYRFFSYDLRKNFYDQLLSLATEADKVDNGNRVAAIKSDFVQFFTESMSPPEKMMGFSALNQVRQILGSDGVLLYPDGPVFSVNVNGKAVNVDADYVRALIKESMSNYYLYLLKSRFDSEKDPSKKEVLRKNIGNLLSSYETYALTQLPQDLSDPQTANYILERFKWNSREDLAGLVGLLGEFTTDSEKKQKLQALGRDIKIKFPAMSGHPPKVFLGKDGKVIAPFWK